MSVAATTASHVPPVLAPGWEEEDVEMLRALAHHGMQVAASLSRQVTAHEAACERGQAEPASRAEAARLSLDFTRASRAVRLTLALKAYVLGGWATAAASAAGAAQPTKPPPPRMLYFPASPEGPDRDDPDACAEYRAAELRKGFDYALSDPELPPEEAERLREGVETWMERESEYERFIVGSPTEMMERICDDLGLECDWRMGLDEEGRPTGWMVARPGDTGAPLHWPAGEAPHISQFMQRWTRRPPAPADPDPPP